MLLHSFCKIKEFFLLAAAKFTLRAFFPTTGEKKEKLGFNPAFAASLEGG